MPMKKLNTITIKTIKKERIEDMSSVLAKVIEIADNVKKCMAKHDALTSDMENLKANNDTMQSKIIKTLEKKEEGVVKAMEDLSGLMQNITDIITTENESMGPILKQVAKDCKQHADDRRATLCAGLMKLARYVKCDSLTKGWQAWFACVGVRKGLSVTILEAMGQSQSGKCSQHKLDLAYQTCLSSLFTFNVLGHLTAGGPK
jgi:hypothetical protein